MMKGRIKQFVKAGIILVIAINCMLFVKFRNHKKYKKLELSSYIYRRSVRNFITRSKEKIIGQKQRTCTANSSTFEASATCVYAKGQTFFATYNMTKPCIFELKDDTKVYVTNVSNHGTSHRPCLIEGTNGTVNGICNCNRHWYGPHCSLPHVVQASGTSALYRLRERPRRIIYAMPFNMELDLLEARVMELGDVVDVFVLLESNYTGHGDPKPLYLLPKLRSGFLKAYQHKLLYTFLGCFPEEGHTNGWAVDNLYRDYLGKQGVARKIRHMRHDDVFVLTDADEIPNRESLLFLKLHDGWTEPVGWHIKANVYGFYGLQNGLGSIRIVAACTVGMLRNVFQFNAIQLRGAVRYMREQAHNLATYQSSGAKVKLWSIGNPNSTAGWHCSWCLRPEDIRVKLLSALNVDFPRWGDYPEKLRLGYIRTLIANGRWFDDKTHIDNVKTISHDYAPKFIMANSKRFLHIYENVYKKKSVDKDRLI